MCDGIPYISYKQRAHDASKSKAPARVYAHRPRSAITPQPRSIVPMAYTSLSFELFIISLLNRNSCARSCGGGSSDIVSRRWGDAPRRGRCR